MGIRSVFVEMAATSLSARFYCVMVRARCNQMLMPLYSSLQQPTEAQMPGPFVVLLLALGPIPSGVGVIHD